MSTMTKSDIAAIQHDIVEEFSHFTDWDDKYEYLIDLGKQLPALEPKYKTDVYLVKGCQSQVWLHGEYHDGRIWLTADSDTVITKGIIALLIRAFSGQKPEHIQLASLQYLDDIGLKNHLSPTRSNGLQSMIAYIRSLADHLPQQETRPKGDKNAEEFRQQMIDAIKQVYDPEIPVDIWELGLIYKLDINDEGKVNVVMTLTSPACPVAESLPMEVQQRLTEIPFVKDVDLKLVWDPGWTKERMSDEARMALDMF